VPRSFARCSISLYTQVVKALEYRIESYMSFLGSAGTAKAKAQSRLIEILKTKRLDSSMTLTFETNILIASISIHILPYTCID